MRPAKLRIPATVIAESGDRDRVILCGTA